MTLFDIVAGLLLLVSAVIGFSRGGVREVVSLVSFTLAAIAAVFLLPISHPLAHALVKPAWASKIAAIAVIFVVTYIALRIAGASISAALHRQATLGAVDRSVGFVVGAGRGLVALGLFCLAFGAMPRFLQPHWIVGGPVYGVGRASGALIASLAPSGLRAVGGFGRVMKDQVSAESDGSSDPAPPSDSGAAPGSGAASADPTVSTTHNSSGSAPYNGRRHRYRSPATQSVVNRPAE